MMNAILSILAIASFAFFVAIVAWFVRQPDLIIILSFGVALGAFDFWRSFRASQQDGG